MNKGVETAVGVIGEVSTELTKGAEKMKSITEGSDELKEVGEAVGAAISETTGEIDGIITDLESAPASFKRLRSRLR